jgi:hypothetical protein
MGMGMGMGMVMGIHTGKAPRRRVIIQISTALSLLIIC